jgi:hypothetical protein
VAREVEDREVSGTECVHFFHGEPPLFRRHDAVRCHSLRETAAFREQQKKTLNKVGLVKVVILLPLTGKNLPVPTVLYPLFLVVIEGNTLQTLPITRQQLFRVLQRG